MLDLILNPKVVLAGLIALAVLTPITAFVALKVRPAVRGRLTLVLGAAGPLALTLWGLYNLLAASLGADSIWTAVIFFTLCAGLGIGFGGWIRGGAVPPRED